jgi:hypothetical protein
MSKPAPYRKTPITTVVCESINNSMSPIIERIRLKIIVPFLPNHSVKKIAEKIPNTDPKIIELFKRVTKLAPSHLKSPHRFARLRRPSDSGV